MESKISIFTNSTIDATYDTLKRKRNLVVIFNHGSDARVIYAIKKKKRIVFIIEQDYQVTFNSLKEAIEAATKMFNKVKEVNGIKQ